MNKQEAITRKVVELIHGMPYDEAVKKELFIFDEDCCGGGSFSIETKSMMELVESNIELGRYRNHRFEPFPITLARLMQALGEARILPRVYVSSHGVFYREDEHIGFMTWQLTKPNGQDCLLHEQSKETLDKIYNLICSDDK